MMTTLSTNQMYSVHTLDGSTYGPVEIDQLKIWVNERRIGINDTILFQDGSPPVVAGNWPLLKDFFKHASGDETIATIIPYRNKCALIGYYLGIFSIFPVLGLPMAIAALMLGVKGLQFRKLHPHAHGKAHSIVAIIGGCVGLMINIVISIAIVMRMVR